MARDYGWTGAIKHGLWRCKCDHWNYYRTATLRIDSFCKNQGCGYRARVVLERVPRRGGRPRQVIIYEYPAYRPPRTIKQEQRERNRYNRRNREMHERMATPEMGDRGTFHTAREIQAAQDTADIERHGGTFRLEPHPNGIRHPVTGDSRTRLNRKRANNDENDS